MQRLTAADSWFLYLETPTVHLHVVGVMVLDPSTAPERMTVRTVRAHVAERLPLLADFRRRVVEVPLGIDHPVWIDDPSFDLDDHLHHHVLDEATPGAFTDWLGRYSSVQLDRSRPLWDMTFVEGLEGGHAAVVAKIHHAMVDGVSGMAIMADLFDIGPDVRRPTVEDRWCPEPVPTPQQAVVDATANRLRTPLRPLRSVGRVAGSAARILATAAGTRLRSGDDAAGPFDAPRTPFNATLTARRSVAMGVTSLDDVKEVRRTYDVTVNDVVLAATALGLRRYLDRTGHLPHRSLTCSVPVSVHTRSQGSSTNQVSDMFVHLPVHLDDPVELLWHVARSAGSGKAVQAAMAPETIGDLIDLVPPPLFHLGVELWSRARLPDRLPPVHNLIVSNVPGSPVPMYFAGARLVALYPFGPLMEGSALNLTVLSNLGDLDVGLIACPDLVPGLDEVMEDLLEGFAQLHRLARRSTRGSRRRSARVRTNGTTRGGSGGGRRGTGRGTGRTSGAAG